MELPAGLLSKSVSFTRHAEFRRFEILNGNLRLVPAPGTKHQSVCLKLAAALLRHVEANDLGRVFQAPYNVVLSRNNVIQPDILFISSRRRGLLSEGCLMGSPDLVVEVLSPISRERDVKIKKRIYAEFEIPEYWIVDPAAATAEVLLWSEIGYLPAAVYNRSQRLSSPMMHFNIPLASVFETGD